MINKKTTITLVCSNLGSHSDGIGHYAYNLTKELESLGYIVHVCSSNIPKSRLKRLISFYMILNVLKATFNRDRVIIEYPFTEINPIIVIAFFLLSLKKRNKVIISLHEYDRVGKLRRMIIDSLIALFQYFLVTDSKLEQTLQRKGKNVCLRHIPSNIEDFINIPVKKKNNRFVYFGLINHTKAINEMLEGWVEFNTTKAFELHVVTSSELPSLPVESNISYIYNASNEEVDQELKEASYIILPIRPTVNRNNASFVAGVYRQCIPIGAFDSSIFNEHFLQMDSYTVDDFVNVFRKASSLAEQDVTERRHYLMLQKNRLPSFELCAQTYDKMLVEISD